MLANSEKLRNMEQIEDDLIALDLEEDDYVLVETNAPSPMSTPPLIDPPSPMSTPPLIDPPSPNLDTHDWYDMLPSCSDRTVTLQTYQLECPDNTKPKMNTTIIDVIKELSLPFLPAKSICRFRSVSKEWNRWLTSDFLAHKQSVQFKDISGFFCQVPGEFPSFLSLHREAYGVPSPSLGFLPEFVNIRSTCSGLLCCRSLFEDDAYYICNPATKEWRQLPNPTLYHAPETPVALAFEPSVFNFSACYELFCAVTPPNSQVIRFEIYSSRTNSWRECETPCCELGSLALVGDGFYFRRYVYWETNSGSLLAFDTKNELYGFIGPPPRIGPDGTWAEMHGELCYLIPDIQGNECRIEVYGDMTMSLKDVILLKPKLVGAEYESFRVLSFVNDDILLIDVGARVVVYHLRAHEVEHLTTKRKHLGYSRYLPYVNSLATVGNPSPYT